MESDLLKLDFIEVFMITHSTGTVDNHKTLMSTGPLHTSSDTTHQNRSLPTASTLEIRSYRIAPHIAILPSQVWQHYHQSKKFDRAGDGRNSPPRRGRRQGGGKVKVILAPKLLVKSCFKKSLTTEAGLEPTRDKPNRFLVDRLNHSATRSLRYRFSNSRI
jgi:hypothetical protein